jgi:predicted  nucleic acid-binding Zn-ribbon protein
MSLIENLVSLHRVDSQVRALRGRLDSATTYLKSQERQHADACARRDELRSQIRQMQATAVNLENESNAIRDRIEALRDELNKSTNQKTYSTILAELKMLQEKRDEADERALAQLGKVEEAKAKLVEVEALAAQRQELLESATKERDQCQADVGDRLAELERERAQAASHVPAKELDLFNRAAEVHEGEAMAEIVATDARRREYVCGACNMELPPEKYAVLSTNPNAAVVCVSCKRILFMAPETQDAATE